MWADQISATGEQAVDGGPKGGYQIGDVIPVSEPAITDVDAAPTQDTAELTSEAPENLPIQETPLSGSVLDVPATTAGTQVDDTLIAFPSTNEASGSDATPKPFAFPTSDAAPIAFPTGTSSDEAASQKAPSTAQAPGITFAPEVGTPERSGTPDPDAEPKRKRISSQNFQRLARRLSVGTRRAGSISNIPILGNLRRDTSVSSAPAPASTDNDAGPSVVSQSPAASIQSEPDKDKPKKKEKEKKRRNFL